MVRLSDSKWEDIFRNVKELGEEVEVEWLDGTKEWVLCSGEEWFEDGFKTEEEACKRLDELEQRLL